MGATLGIVQIRCVCEATFVLLLWSFLLFFPTPRLVPRACVLTSVYLRRAGDVGFPRLITTLIPAPCFCFFPPTPPPRFTACVEVVWAPSGLPHHRSMPDPVIQLSICVIDFFFPPLPSLFVEFHLSSTFLRSDGEGGERRGKQGGRDLRAAGMGGGVVGVGVVVWMSVAGAAEQRLGF